MQTQSETSILYLTANIAAAYLGKNAVPADTVPNFIRSVFDTLSALETGEPAQLVSGVSNVRPAVPVEESIEHDHIICLEDGKKLRMLKRYLMSQYGLTPDAYRQKWGLPLDYPMSAPAVSEKRRASAFERGLGQNMRSRKRSGSKRSN